MRLRKRPPLLTYLLLWVPCYSGFGVRGLELRGHPGVGPWGQVGCGSGVPACYEVQHGPRCYGCVGVTGPTSAGHLFGGLGGPFVGLRASCGVVICATMPRDG